MAKMTERHAMHTCWNTNTKNTWKFIIRLSDYNVSPYATEDKHEKLVF